ncbi:unnamed protein product [Allacma fusca]|uniref:Acyltransferase n=1 Tax=Allacma fusca TaxID=39272 RepID=A0A8J2LT63_9HEXA|nr:unnamed protein product [Allacma fusca]
MDVGTVANITLAAIWFVTGPVALVLMPYLLFYTSYYPYVIAYWLWCLYDRHTKSRIKRRSDWFRKLFVWDYLRDYYPCKLVKTAELDPSRNYVIGLHPHGISVAGGLNFATETGGFSKKFPGIRPFVLVHELLLLFVPSREIAVPLGFSSVAKASFQYLLQERDGGNAIVLVPGGVKEMIATRHGNNIDLFLKNRKGFVREALINGASLVPAFTFGEHELYIAHDVKPGSLFAKLQKLISQYLHLPLLNVTGKYMFLPLQKPITTVVGTPIHIERNIAPTKAEIDDLHSKYIQNLVDLFETQKGNYGGKDQKLTFL